MPVIMSVWNKTDSYSLSEPPRNFELQLWSKANFSSHHITSERSKGMEKVGADPHVWCKLHRHVFLKVWEDINLSSKGLSHNHTFITLLTVCTLLQTFFVNLTHFLFAKCELYFMNTNCIVFVLMETNKMFLYQILIIVLLFHEHYEPAWTVTQWLNLKSSCNQFVRFETQVTTDLLNFSYYPNI